MRTHAKPATSQSMLATIDRMLPFSDTTVSQRRRRAIGKNTSPEAQGRLMDSQITEVASISVKKLPSAIASDRNTRATSHMVSSTKLGESTQSHNIASVR